MTTKYLLALLDAKPRQASQLKALLVEAKEGGVRDEKASFNEFTETLERITQELRSDPNAMAFMSRVKKIEAPDYYDIVKKPMDLGTVWKKAKAGTYKSKSQFKEDLDLIWSNCYLYNTFPAHPLRTAAASLKQRANAALEFVTEPNISRAMPAVVQNTAQSQASRHLGLSAAEVKWAQRRDHPLSGLAFGAVPPPETRVDAQTNGFARHLSRDASYDVDGDEIEAGEADETPPLGFIDQPALLRTSSGMEHFSTTCLASSSSSWITDGPVAGPSVPRGLIAQVNGRHASEPNDNDSNAESGLAAFLTHEPILAEWASLVSSDMLANGIPKLPFPSAPPLRIRGVKDKTTRKKREWKARKGKGKASEKSEGLRPQIERNIATLQEIRKVHEKMCGMLSTTAMDGEPAEEESGDEVDTKRSELRIPKKVFNTQIGHEVAYDMVQYCTSTLLAHTGFDAVRGSALHCLVEVAMQYLRNVGRTLNFYSNRFSKNLTPGDMIVQTLRQNGVTNLSILDSHVKDDIQKYGVKLQELLKKLQSGYNEMAEGSGREVFGDDTLFARDGEAMVMGTFTNELGEDFFGLRELGLDSELGSTSLNIPTRLFHGLPKAPPLAEGIVSTEPQGEARFVRPTAFVVLVPEAIDQQIGLLRPFYRARMQQVDVGLLDDAHVTKPPKVFRPKVPPSGKIPVKRRSPGEGSKEGGAGAAKRKKKVDG